MMNKDTTLKGILHALNSIASSLNTAYQPLDERVYDNEQREFIIDKAAAYIEEKKEASTFRTIDLDYDYGKDCVTCTIYNFNGREKKLTHRAVHYIDIDNEVGNMTIASAIALAKALGQEVEWLTNIPQPYEIKIGNTVQYNDERKVITNKEPTTELNKLMYCVMNSEHAIKGRLVYDD